MRWACVAEVWTVCSLSSIISSRIGFGRGVNPNAPQKLRRATQRPVISLAVALLTRGVARGRTYVPRISTRLSNLANFHHETSPVRMIIRLNLIYPGDKALSAGVLRISSLSGNGNGATAGLLLRYVAGIESTFASQSGSHCCL